MRKNKELKIVKNHKRWFVISCCIITLGIIMFAIFAGIGKGFNKGLNLGIDFTGGTQLDVEMGSLMNDDNKEDIKKIITSTLNEFGINDRNPVQITNDNDGFTVAYRASSEKSNLVLNGGDGALSLKSRLVEKINVDNSAQLIRVSYRSIAPTAKTSSIGYVVLAVAVAWIIIILYIAFRFEWSAALTAVFGLVHDILIIFAFMAIFRIQITSAFIAVLITIACYSIYNLIVVFDRMRDNARSESINESSASELVDKSVSEIFRRIMYTTIVLCLIPLTLFIGGPVVIGVAVAVILSLVAGMYSSTFIVPSIWAMYKEKQDKTGKREYFRRKLIFKRTEKTESNIMENQKDE